MYKTAQQECIKTHGRSHMSHARKSARRSSRRTSRRGLPCMSGLWQAARGSRRTRRLPHEDPRVGVAVGVGPMEFKLNRSR